MIDQIEFSGIQDLDVGMTLQEYIDSLSLTVAEDAPYTLGAVKCGDMKPGDVFEGYSNWTNITVEIHAKPGYGFWSFYDAMDGEYRLICWWTTGPPRWRRSKAPTRATRSRSS